MLTIRKQITDWDGHKRVVKLQEDQFGKYHLRKFCDFQETMHQILDVDDEFDAILKYVKEMN